MKPSLTLEFMRELTTSQLTYHQALMRIIESVESLEEAKRVAADAVYEANSETSTRVVRSSHARQAPAPSFPKVGSVPS